MRQRVLITGTTSGIGLGLLRYYAQQGWDVVSFNRRRDPALESYFPGARFLSIDVCDREAIRAYFREAAARDELPQIYYLNAGINKADNAGSFSLDIFEEVMKINFTGVLNFIDAALPLLPGRKAVFVFTSSTSIIFPNASYLSYYISKLGITKIFRLWGARYRNKGIVFKTLVLGPVETELLDTGSAPDSLEGRIRKLVTVNPDKLVPKIVAFVHSRRKTFYYSKGAFLLYLLAAVIHALPIKIKAR